MDPLYLQAISELENEYDTLFPKKLVNILADKTFHHRVSIMSYQIYHCAHPMNRAFFYHYCKPRVTPDPFEECVHDIISKVDLYKRYIHIPIKIYANPRQKIISSTHKETTEEYWMWQFEYDLYCIYRSKNQKEYIINFNKKTFEIFGYTHFTYTKIGYNLPYDIPDDILPDDILSDEDWTSGHSLHARLKTIWSPEQYETFLKETYKEEN